MGSLKEKIENRSAAVGIIGLGYVGLPLAVEFALKGFRVTGIDIDRLKVDDINGGVSYIPDVDSGALKSVVGSGRLRATSDFDAIDELDALVICVPTPFSKNKDPDISYIVRAAEEIKTRLHRGQLIILKSTTFPETTETIVQPILESSGLVVGVDFYLAFSPERIDPGNTVYTINNTPVVVGGVTAECTALAGLLHGQICPQILPVSSPRVAEMEKLLENVFRSVNIALVNELARMCDRMGHIDVWEVVEAAASKPFGFMPFYPGPGIGGHCILVDPYFLSWKAREYDFHSNFIELAAETNENMPFYVFNLMVRALNRIGVTLGQARFLILGVAFKRDVNDTRNSPALRIMKILLDNAISAGRIIYNDPYVPAVRVGDVDFVSQDLTEQLLRSVDCVVILTDHRVYDYRWIVSRAKIVVDTRNATKGIEGREKNVVRLGTGF